jgi:exopolysaccharide production protein ExoZ
MGLLVAWLAPVGGAARGPLALGTLALVGGIVAELTGNLDGIGFPAQLLYGGGSALLLLGLLRREAAAPIHASGPLRLLGDASYSIYLFHLAGIGIADKLLQVIGIDDYLHPDARFAFVVAGGLALGTALGTWIEPRLTRAVRARLR